MLFGHTPTSHSALTYGTKHHDIPGINSYLARDQRHVHVAGDNTITGEMTPIYGHI